MSIPIILALISAFILGVAKAGVKGVGIIIVALMANAFDAKASTGILLPLLLVGDVLSVVYYKKHVKWKYLWSFLPVVLLGVILAAFVGHFLDEKAFKFWMAVIILISVVVLFYRDLQNSQSVSHSKWFGYAMGVTAGFTTMIGNLAGPFANIYFLSTRLPKNEFIGTAAWLFLLTNVVKLPVHIFSWHTITRESILIDVYLVPAVIIGFFLGLRIVRYFTEDWYRKFLLIATAIGAIFILF